MGTHVYASILGRQRLFPETLTSYLSNSTKLIVLNTTSFKEYDKSEIPAEVCDQCRKVMRYPRRVILTQILNVD